MSSFESELCGVRTRILHCAILFGAWLALGTELLSLFQSLAFGPVLVLWSIGGGLLSLRFLWGPYPSRLIPALSWGEKLALGSVGVLLLLAAISALVAPPNQWDGHVYHLPRQIRWIQQAGVQHFPTHLLHQLFMPPFAEFIGCHSILLSGSDRLVNLVQWTALLLSAVAASMIAAEMGCSRKGQILSGILVITVPIAWMEASTPKNDVVFALWYLTLAWLIQLIHRQRRCGPGASVLVGCNLGLLFLTKASAPIVVIPLGVVLVGVLVSLCHVSRNWLALLGSSFLIVFLGLLICAGHYGRNLRLFGSVFSPPGVEASARNELTTGPAILSNLLRQTGLHLGTPMAPLNRILATGLDRAHDWIGLEPDDPRTTWRGSRFQLAFVPGDDTRAGAPVHVLLSFLLLALVIPLRRQIPQPGFWWLLPVPFISLLCICVLLKFHATFSRLHIAMIFLLAPLIARLFETQALKRLRPVVGCLLLLAMIPTLRWNPRTPFGPRYLWKGELEQLFIQMPPQRQNFQRAAEYANSFQPTVVGLRSKGLHGWEYPVMRLTRRTFYLPHYVGFNVENASRRLETEDAPPEVVISLEPVGAQIDQLSGQVYLPAKQFGPITVLRPDEP